MPLVSSGLSHSLVLHSCLPRQPSVLSAFVFIGSVAVDSNLLYLPSVGCLLIAAAICGWFTKKPHSHRWIWWSGGVGIICWTGPLYQHFFEARPNMSSALAIFGDPWGRKGPEN